MNWLRPLKFQLDEGREVSLVSFVYGYTYQSLLEGHPHREMDKSIVKRALKRAESIWNRRPTYLIEPEYGTYEDGSPFGIIERLPNVTMTAWFESWEPIHNRSMCGSQLVVVWFRDDWGEKPIQQVFQEDIKSIPWSQHAEDFDV